MDAMEIENWRFPVGFVGRIRVQEQDEFRPEGLCKAAMYALYVKEELESWPEQTRSRTWLTIPEAAERYRHAWMKCALEEGFCKWHQDKDIIN